MKAYCKLPFFRIKIDSDGRYQSCCHQTTYYGNLLTDGLTLEESYKNSIAREFKNSVMTSKLHDNCNNTQCPLYYKPLDRNIEVSLAKYPKEIELALPSTLCNIGGIKPTKDTACVMCPRSSEEYMNSQPKEDYTDRLLEIIKPSLPYLDTFTVLGVAEPFWKGKVFDVLDKLDFKDYKNDILFWTYSNGSIFGDKYQDMFLNEYTTKSCIGFSVDAATPETYIKIRRLNYLKTIQSNLEKYFKKINNYPVRRDWSFTAYNINMLNLHEMEDMLRFGNSIGVYKVQFTLTYVSDSGMSLPISLICNGSNWQTFWEAQQRIEQIAKEINQVVDFYVQFHGGFLK